MSTSMHAPEEQAHPRLDHRSDPRPDPRTDPRTDPRPDRAPASPHDYGIRANTLLSKEHQGLCQAALNYVGLSSREYAEAKGFSKFSFSRIINGTERITDFWVGVLTALIDEGEEARARILHPAAA